MFLDYVIFLMSEEEECPDTSRGRTTELEETKRRLSEVCFIPEPGLRLDRSLLALF